LRFVVLELEGFVYSLYLGVTGTLKTRDWKTRDHEKYGDGNGRMENTGPKRMGGIAKLENAEPNFQG